MLSGWIISINPPQLPAVIWLVLITPSAGDKISVPEGIAKSVPLWALFPLIALTSLYLDDIKFGL